MKRDKDRMFCVCMILFSLLLCSCSPMSEVSGTENIEKSKLIGNCIGVVYTKTQKADTRIFVYDESGKKVTQKNYSMAMVGRFGFGIPQYRKGKMYEIAVGNDYKKNAGIVMCYDFYKNTVEEIEFDRINLVDLQVTEKNIYVISNISGTTYIDCYNLMNRKIETFMWKKGMVTDFAVSENDEIYFATPDGEVYSVNMKENKTSYICSIGKDIAYMYAIRQKLYFSLSNAQKGMLVVNPKNGKKHWLELDIHPVGQPFFNEGFLYVASNDPAGILSSTEIVKIKLENEKVTDRWKFDSDIHYFAVSGNVLYTLSWLEQKVRIYDMENSTLLLKKEIDVSVDDKDYKLSSMGIGIN